jgi:hypothetical protein
MVMEDQTREMRQEHERLDEDIEALKKAKATLDDPMHLGGQGPAYYESGSKRPTKDDKDDQQITPPG